MYRVGIVSITKFPRPVPLRGGHRGGTVALGLTEGGTHDGEFMGIEPTGKEFEIQTMAFFRIEDGRVAEWWIQPDTLGFIQQLGINPEDLSEAVPADDD